MNFSGLAMSYEMLAFKEKLTKATASYIRQFKTTTRHEFHSSFLNIDCLQISIYSNQGAIISMRFKLSFEIARKDLKNSRKRSVLQLEVLSIDVPHFHHLGFRERKNRLISSLQ